MSIGFVGLGTMGAPMAGHLLRAGFDLAVWSRTASKAEALEQQGAVIASSLADLGARCEVVFLCVNRSEDVEQCANGIAYGAPQGSMIVDHSTIAPQVAARLHGALAERGIAFVDAPITGGSMGAQKGQLTIFCGGDQDSIDRAMPYMGAYAKRAERVGPAGSGQLMKLANQIAVGGALMALCECLSFAAKAGLDVRQGRELIGGGAAGSWAFENYGPKIIERDWSPGFSVKNQRKDFAYCRQAALEIDAAVPGTELVDALLAKLDQEGRGEWTTAALYEVYMEMAARS